jgi:hypothetical protein
MNHRAVGYATAVVLFAGMCVLENAAVQSSPEGKKGQTDSIYAIAGEFRVVFANLLWVKADQYHHEFIARNSDWTRNKELLGMIDLIVALDPTFVEAYATGTYILAEGLNDYRRALNFARQGICNNPRSSELYRIVSIIYAKDLHQPEAALVYARKARQFAEDEWYRTRAVRLVRSIERMIREKRGVEARS